MDAPRHVLRDLYREVREGLKIDRSLLADLYSRYVITLDVKNAINKIDETSYSDRAEFLLDRLQGCPDKVVDSLCAALHESCEANSDLAERITAVANMQRTERALRPIGTPLSRSSYPCTRQNSQNWSTGSYNSVAVIDRRADAEQVHLIAQGRPGSHPDLVNSLSYGSDILTSTSICLDDSASALQSPESMASFQDGDNPATRNLEPRHTVALAAGSSGDETYRAAASTSSTDSALPVVREKSPRYPKVDFSIVDARPQRSRARPKQTDDIGRGYEIGILGASGVGKTQFIRCVAGEDFQLTKVTFFDNRTVEMYVDGVNIRLTLWDTAGTERFRNTKVLLPALRYCHGIALMYDMTDIKSLQELHCWKTEAKNICPKCALLVVGNKQDMEMERTVPESKGRKTAKSLGADYIPCSAKTGENAEEACALLVRQIMKMRDEDLTRSRNAIKVHQEEEKQREKSGCPCKPD